LQYQQCIAEAMQFLGLVQHKAADCHKSQDALHLLKELGSFQAELLPSQQRRLDEIKLLARNRGMTFTDLTVKCDKVITALLQCLYDVFGIGLILVTAKYPLLSVLCLFVCLLVCL